MKVMTECRNCKDQKIGKGNVSRNTKWKRCADIEWKRGDRNGGDIERVRKKIRRIEMVNT